MGPFRFGLVYWGVTPQQKPGSYQSGEMMMMKSVFWWRFSGGHPPLGRLSRSAYISLFNAVLFRTPAQTIAVNTRAL